MRLPTPEDHGSYDNIVATLYHPARNHKLATQVRGYSRSCTYRSRIPHNMEGKFPCCGGGARTLVLKQCRIGSKVEKVGIEFTTLVQQEGPSDVVRIERASVERGI